jgi:hypothetical protein
LRNPLDREEVVAHAPKLERKVAAKPAPRRVAQAAPSVTKVTIIRGTRVDSAKTKL